MSDSVYQNMGSQSQGDQADMAKAKLVEDWVHSHSQYLHTQNGHISEDTINQALKGANGEDHQVLSFLSQHYQDLVKLQGDTPSGPHSDQLTVAGLTNLELVDSATLKATEDAHPANHNGFWHSAIDIAAAVGAGAAGSLTGNPFAAYGGAVAGFGVAEAAQDYLESRDARQVYEQRADSARNMLKDLNP